VNKKLRLGCAWLWALSMCSAGNAADWVQTWGAAPLPPSQAMGPFPASPVFSNQTVRQIVRASVGGRRFRLRLTNEYGTKPLAVGAVRVALLDDKNEVLPETDRVVLFAGKTSTSVPAGAPYLSDPIDLPINALSSLSISLYLPEDTGQCTCHAVGMQTALVSGHARTIPVGAAIRHRLLVLGCQCWFRSVPK